MVSSGVPAISNQKKRALEALERRFAIEKAETKLSRSNKKQILRKEDTNGENLKRPSLITSNLRSSHAVENRLPMLSSKRESFTFADHRSRGTHGVSDVDANNPAYAPISLPINENLLSIRDEMSSNRGSLVDKVVHELLKNGDSAMKYMQGSRNMKIDNWILLDNFVKGSSLRSHAKVVETHSNRSKKHMSMQQLRKCGSYDLPQVFHDFNLFIPMHEMWKDYIIQLLKLVGNDQIAPSLLQADLHGAFILVVECKVTSFSGVNGIMIRETKETFGIITQDNKFRVVPKIGSIFMFQADCWKITLHGNKLSLRNIVC